jgi:hypothetical protein
MNLWLLLTLSCIASAAGRAEHSTSRLERQQICGRVIESGCTNKRPERLLLEVAPAKLVAVKVDTSAADTSEPDLSALRLHNACAVGTITTPETPFQIGLQSSP